MRKHERIYHIIPGVLINDKSIVNRISTLLDSIPFNKWIEVNEKIYSSNFFQQYDEFYVMYLDPQGLVERLWVTGCQDIVSFMKDRVSYEYGDGVDMAICTKEINNAVICNHDGQVFMLKEQ